MMFRKLILMLSLIFCLNSCTYYNAYREMKEDYEDFKEGIREFDSLYHYRKDQAEQEKHQEKLQQDKKKDNLIFDTNASKQN